MTATLVQFPDKDVGDVPKSLRTLADAIEGGKYDDAHNLVWVIDCGGSRIEVGLIGASPSPASLAYFLLGLGMRRIEP